MEEDYCGYYNPQNQYYSPSRQSGKSKDGYKYVVEQDGSISVERLEKLKVIDFKNKFKIGEVVRLSTGCTPMIVVATSKRDITAVYTSKYFGETQRHRAAFVPWDGETEKVLKLFSDAEANSNKTSKLLTSNILSIAESNYKKEENMTQLYQTNEDTPRYGTFLIRNSKGQIVLEMKPTGDVEAFEPNAVKEVMPYTVKIGYSHYEVDEGLVEEGDIVGVIDGDGDVCFQTVSAIDTRHKRPDKASIVVLQAKARYNPN